MNAIQGLASGIQRHMLTTLLNGHFNHVMPKIQKERSLELKQVQMRVAKRLDPEYFNKAYVQVEPKRELILRLKHNPLMHQSFRNLFSEQELYDHMDTVLLVRSDVAAYCLNTTAVRVREFKHMFSEIPAVTYALRLLNGTITEAEQRRMRSESRYIDMTNTLLSMVVSSSGLAMNDGVISSESDLALRVLSLNTLLRVLNKYSDIDGETLDNNYTAERLMSYTNGAAMDIIGEEE
jgi:hypothetical protein